ncbi:tape measure protein [Prescottella defluvii]|nr:tape measure protein [Prescottella defluvii]
MKLVGDAAAIAGTDLGSMGSIFNKVAASNKIQGDVIAQLSDAGIPVIQMLGKELGKTSEEVVKLASDGKINFDQFQNSIQKGLGGAALESGKTVSGAFKNMNAALGRLGAEALKPTFMRLGGGVGGLTGALDKATPKVGELAKALDDRIFNQGLPKLHEAFLKFRESDFATSTMSKSVTIMDQLRTTAVATAPALKDVGKSLAEASAVTGGAGLTLGLQTITGVATAVSGPLTTALNGASGVMKEHQSVVTGLLMGYAGIRAINWMSQTKSMQGLQSAVTGTSGSLKTATGTMAAMRAVSASTGQEMSRLQSAVGYMSTGSGTMGSLLSRSSRGSRMPRSSGGRWARCRLPVPG